MRRPRGQGFTTGECQHCQQSFRHPARFNQKYCSVACKHAAASGATNWLKTFECLVCGTPFQAARTLDRKTCSKQCGRISMAKKRTDPSKSVNRPCPECGKQFTFYLSWPRTYCSKACGGKASIANIKHFVPSRFSATCESCGQQFETTPARTRGRFCSQTCFGQWLSEYNVGEANARFRGGSEPYYGGSWKSARRRARARDEVCRDCGVSPEQLGKALDVHHIVPFKRFGVVGHKEANALSNLVSLCPKCHTAREWATNWGPFKAHQSPHVA